MSETAELRVSEAVPLAHALVARLADLEGIRILFIKGPTAVALGARPPRPSTDVDVLCEPGGKERLGAALEACGWRLRAPRSKSQHLAHAAQYLFDHSVHYIHENWPCDLDVHYNFPGFFAPEDIVFEAIWTRRISTTVANTSVPCADALGQMMFVGLHALRDPEAPRSQTDLAHLQSLARQLNGDDAAALAEMASSTGCVDTLHPLLDCVDAVPPSNPWADPEALRRWTVRTQYASTYTTSWLIELRHTRWVHRPSFLWRALFLSRDELLSHQLGIPPGWRSIVRLQARRWWRAMRHLKRGMDAARRSEEGLL